MGVACCFRREGASLSNTRVNITGILFSGISLSQKQNYGVIPLTNDIKSRPCPGNPRVEWWLPEARWAVPRDLLMRRHCYELRKTNML